MNIPETAIEAAEQVIWERTDGGGPVTARLTLEAAAPMIAAQALREAADYLEAKDGLDAPGMWKAAATLRYRAALEYPSA